MSWRSSIGRNRFPNVFDQNFSWYKDNPKDDPMRASKIPSEQQESASQASSSPQVDSQQLSWQTASQQNESAHKNSLAWVIALIIVLAAALFLFAR